MKTPADELDSIIEAHWPRVYRIALAVLRDPASAEDAAQDAFIRLLAERRRGGRIEDLGAWLATVALNEARRTLRSRDRRTRREEAASPRKEGAMDPTLAVREYAESLPEKLRLPLVLHFGLGLSHAEVAAMLGDKKPTVTSRIQAGVEQIRRELAGTGALASLASAALIESTLKDGWGALRDAAVPHPPVAKTLEELATNAPRAAVGSKVLAALVAASLLAVMGSRLAGSRDAVREAGSMPSAGALSSTAPVATFTLPLPPPTAPEVAARDPGFEKPPASREPVGVAVIASAARAVTVSGRVLDPERRPVAGANVIAFDLAAAVGEAGALRRRDVALDPDALARSVELAQSWRRLASATTGADGRFEIAARSSLEAGHLAVAVDLGVGERALAASKRIACPASKGDARSIDAGDLVLADRPVVTVSVRARGAPVAAKVTFQEVAAPWPHSTTIETTEGSAAVRHVAHADELLLSVEQTGFGTEHRRIVVGTEDERVEVSLEPETAVAGQVRDELGAPVGGAVIRAIDETAPESRIFRYERAPAAKTDAEGRYTLRGLAAPRAYTLVVAETDEHRGASRRVTTPATSVDFELERQGPIVVTVDPAARRGVVLLQEMTASGDWADVGRWTLRDGSARIARTPGRYRVRVHASGYAPATSEPATLRAGGEGVALRLALDPGRSVSGELVFRDGVPVRSAFVTWLDDPDAPKTGFVSEDGRFTVRDLPPERACRLCARASGAAELVFEAGPGVRDVGTVVLDRASGDRK